MEDTNDRVVATEEEKLKIAHSLYAAYLDGQITGEDYQSRYASLMATVYVDEALSFLNGISTGASDGQPVATLANPIATHPLSTQKEERELDPVDIALLMRSNSQTRSKNDYRWITVAAAIIFIILLLLLGIMLMSRVHSSSGGTPSSISPRYTTSVYGSIQSVSTRTVMNGSR